jgi:microcystin-dependent protein
MPAHGHGLNAASNLTQADPSSAVGFGPVAMYNSGGNSQDMAGEALGSAGGAGAPHNNMQPYLTMNFIIALTGVYPSRS